VYAPLWCKSNFSFLEGASHAEEPLEEAHRLGLLTRLLDSDDDVLPAAQELAGRLAAGPTVAYAQIKRELFEGANGTLADALTVELAAQTAAGGTTDHREATNAFVEKRPPLFTGR